MRELTLFTDMHCSACGALVEVTYTYDIHSEQLVSDNELVIGSPVPIQSWIKINPEFSCSICGILYIPKKNNSLKVHDCKTISNVLFNYQKIQLTGEVPAELFVSDDPSSNLLSREEVVVVRMENSHLDFSMTHESEKVFILPGSSGQSAKLFDTKKVWQEKADKRFQEVKEKALAIFEKGNEDKARAYARRYDMEFIFAGNKDKESAVLKEISKFYKEHPQSQLQLNQRKLYGCDRKLAKLPKPPAGAMEAAQVWVVDKNLNLVQYWIPTEVISTD